MNKQNKLLQFNVNDNVNEIQIEANYDKLLIWRQPFPSMQFSPLSAIMLGDEYTAK